VLNSRYFEGQIDYFPDEDQFVDGCAKGIVTLQTQSQEMSLKNTESESQPLEEWMLACRAETIAEKPSEVFYYVSRAYNSHYVFVYLGNDLTREWFLKNISKNISVIVDECVEPHCITI
jgi:hypothetical protein